MIRVKENAENPSQAFSNMFNAYTKAYNKRYDRVWSLFQRPFKRIRITEEKYLKQLIVSIHLNPETYRIIENFENYSHSSYKSILSKKSTELKRVEIINLFEDTENFQYIHRQRHSISEDLEYMIE